MSCYSATKKKKKKKKNNMDYWAPPSKSWNPIQSVCQCGLYRMSLLIFYIFLIRNKSNKKDLNQSIVCVAKA